MGCGSAPEGAALDQRKQCGDARIRPTICADFAEHNEGEQQATNHANEQPAQSRLRLANLAPARPDPHEEVALTLVHFSPAFCA